MLRGQMLLLYIQGKGINKVKFFSNFQFFQKDNMSFGSFIIMGLKGETLSSEEKKTIEQEDIGGVILFKRNLSSYLSSKALIQELKNLKTSARPLIISIDREGGVVDRLKHLKEFYPWPNPSALRFCNLWEIEQTSFYLHHELKHLGINMNWSPCLDVPIFKSEVLKGRAFSKNPLQVAQIGKSVVQGAHQAQVLTCAKHFPGHGGVYEDSHLVLPQDLRSRSRILMDSVFPFLSLFSSKVSSVMLAHILYPSLDSQRIAPLSPFIIQNLLKKYLNFKGLIVSDDLEMKAVKNNINLQWMEQALKAGVHMFISGQSLEMTQKILSILKTFKKSALLKSRQKEIQDFKKKNLIYLTSPSPQLMPCRDAWFNKLEKKISGSYA